MSREEYKESQFQVQSGFFTPDDRELIVLTNDGKLRVLDLHTRQLRLAAEGVVGNKAGLMSESHVVLEEKTNLLRYAVTGYPYDLGQRFPKGVDVLGISTFPYLLLFDRSIAPGRFLLLDLKTGKSRWVIREHGQPWVYGPTPHWFPSRRMVFLTSNNHYRLLDVEHAEWIPLNVKTQYQKGLVVDDDELGFVYAGSSHNEWSENPEGRTRPFLFDLRTRKATPLPFENIPISLSMRRDRLWVWGRDVGWNLEELKISAGFTKVWGQKGVGSGGVRPRGSKWMVFLPNAGDPYLKALNLETYAIKRIGVGDFGRGGIFIASSSGNLIAHTSHRTVEVFWVESLEQEHVQSLHVQI